MYNLKSLLIIALMCGVLNALAQNKSLSYNVTGTNVFIVGSPITSLVPVVKNAAVTSYTIDPVVPAGLVFDLNTGIISGSPTSISPATVYTITATSSTDRLTSKVSIAISTAWSAYQTPVVSLLVDTDVTPNRIRPAVMPANVVFTTTDILPDGLSLNSATGEIYGHPKKSYTPKTYTIIATDITTGLVTPYRTNISVPNRGDVLAKNATTISFVGQGDIQTSLNTRSKLAANTGIGVIFRQNSNAHFGILHDIEVDFSINVASTVDTIKSINNGQNMVTNKQDYGNSVLLPLNSGQAFSFNFKGYFSRRGGEAGNYRRNEAPKPLLGVLSGFNISLNGSNRNWEYDDSVKTIAPTLVKTSLLSLYIGPFYEFYTPTSDNSYNRNISITLGIGYSARWILGDIQQGNQVDFRNKLLGTSKSAFSGAELQLALRFYNIKAEVHLPFLSKKQNVPGLTGTHLTTFIGFSGGFPIDLKKGSNGGS